MSSTQDRTTKSTGEWSGHVPSSRPRGAHLPAHGAGDDSGDVCVSAAALPAPVPAFDLRADNVVNPLAAGSAPTLSWKLRSGDRQTAYRILVASSPRLLAEHRADVWDSGKVASADSVARALSRARRWRRRSGTTGPSRCGARAAALRPGAEPAWWETGPARPADWAGAEWITPDTGGATAWQDFALDVDFTHQGRGRERGLPGRRPRRLPDVAGERRHDTGQGAAAAAREEPRGGSRSSGRPT